MHSRGPDAKNKTRWSAKVTIPYLTTAADSTAASPEVAQWRNAGCYFGALGLALTKFGTKSLSLACSSHGLAWALHGQRVRGGGCTRCRTVQGCQLLASLLASLPSPLRAAAKKEKLMMMES